MGILIVIITTIFVFGALKLFPKEGIKNYTYTYIWSDITMAQNQLPNSDTPIDISQAKSITIEAESSDISTHTSTDWVLNVVVSAIKDGRYKYYSAKGFSRNDSGVLLVTTGPNFMKLRLDENSGLIANVKAIVTLTV